MDEREKQREARLSALAGLVDQCIERLADSFEPRTEDDAQEGGLSLGVQVKLLRDLIAGAAKIHELEDDLDRQAHADGEHGRVDQTGLDDGEEVRVRQGLSALLNRTVEAKAGPDTEPLSVGGSINGHKSKGSV